MDVACLVACRSPCVLGAQLAILISYLFCPASISVVPCIMHHPWPWPWDVHNHSRLLLLLFLMERIQVMMWFGEIAKVTTSCIVSGLCVAVSPGTMCMWCAKPQINKFSLAPIRSPEFRWAVFVAHVCNWSKVYFSDEVTWLAYRCSVPHHHIICCIPTLPIGGSRGAGGLQPPSGSMTFP
jgi:hypothetical protein